MFSKATAALLLVVQGLVSSALANEEILLPTSDRSENPQEKRILSSAFSKQGHGSKTLSSSLTKLVALHGSPGDSFAIRNLLPSFPHFKIVDLDRVLVDIIGEEDTLEETLKGSTLPIRVTGCFARTCSAYVPIGKLESLSTISEILFVRPSLSTNYVGSVTSEGDAAMKANSARVEHFVNGSGVIVGVLSDSFDCLGTAAFDIESGDLPGNVTVLLDSIDSCTDEGRAMLQLIHDVAPGAQLAFRRALEGQPDFVKGIFELANIGCDVIVDDVGYLTEPFLQDGFIAQAADTVVERGIPFFSAAGNSGRQSWDSPGGFLGSGQRLSIEGEDAGEAHVFGTDDAGNDVIIMPILTTEAFVPTSFTMILQWDEPFFSVSGIGSESDLDAFIYRQANGLWTEVVAEGADFNLGHDPIEIISFDALDDEPTTYGLAITLSEGRTPAYMKTITFGLDLDLQFPTFASTCFGHPNAKYTAGVGAASYSLTPVFGVTPPLAEEFSSAGGTPIFFTPSGERLTKPEVRPQPRFVGPDRTVTTFFGEQDLDGNFRFAGTSAAAPHVAAVATLMLQLDSSLSPTQIYSILEGTAVDMDDPLTKGFDVGFDYLTGYGFVDASEALAAVEHRNIPGASKSKKSKKRSKSSREDDSSDDASRDGVKEKSRKGMSKRDRDRRRRVAS